MKNKMIIRENTEAYMKELRRWTEQVQDSRLEEMASFFRDRLGEYEAHMSVWRSAYKHLAALIPENTETLLDLGCGTGLELDEILPVRPALEVTGIDLSQDMLAVLSAKHPQVKLIQADYFRCDFGKQVYDMAVSFESLHHFKPALKQKLYRRIWEALKEGGTFIEADYIACCEEEETLLMGLYDSKREKEKIPENVYVHFDTPLTWEHEREALSGAGFTGVELICSIEGATFIRAKK